MSALRSKKHSVSAYILAPGGMVTGRHGRTRYCKRPKMTELQAFLADLTFRRCPSWLGADVDPRQTDVRFAPPKSGHRRTRAAVRLQTLPGRICTRALDPTPPVLRAYNAPSSK